jgi:hypothetical protein
MATQISKNFTLEELCASSTAKAYKIANVPGKQEICCLCALVHHVLQPLRDYIGKPISLSSGYRCPVLNAKVGGVSTSQHMKGQAADINIKGDMKTGKEWFEFIKKNLTFDQLIWEHSKSGTYWIHVSYRPDGKNRGQVIDNLLKR